VDVSAVRTQRTENQITVVEEDERLKSGRMWIKWTELRGVPSLRMRDRPHFCHVEDLTLLLP
jgi:hypothetical protein